MTLGTATRFLSTIPDYVAHRLRYPDSLIAALARLVRLQRQDPVLDLGTGPGFLAIALAAHSDRVLGLDPSAAMLAVAREAAQGTSVRFEEGSSLTLERLEPGLRLVTMGRSFHWMDRDATLVALDRLVAPGGAVALLDVKRAEAGRDAAAMPWREAFDQVLRDWEARLGPDPERDAIKRRAPHAVVLDRSVFSVRVLLSVETSARRSPAELVGRARSQSGTSPARLGDHVPAFQRAVLAALEPFVEADGRLLEHSRATAMVAFRPGEL